MLFDIDAMLADEPETTTTNVVAFPAETLVLERIRTARRYVALMEQAVLDADPNSPDVATRVMVDVAPRALADWRAKLKAAEADYAVLTSDWKLTHRGQTFTTIVGRA